MSDNIPEEKLAAITDAIFRRRKIEAIKLYRECTGVHLAEAKAAVERLEEDLRRTSPEKFQAAGKGCAGMFIVGALLAVAVTGAAVKVAI